MKKPIRLINLGKTESWKTQAVYHALAEEMTVESPDTIVLCQPDSPYLCLGFFQPFDSVFDLKNVDHLNLPVYRRRIGGGATYLDENQLFYQFIFHHSRVPVVLEKAYKTMLAAPVETLKSFGLDCNLRAANEIEVNGKRVAGIGGGRINDAAVVVGNFLFDFNFEAMTTVWKSPWVGFRELAKDAVKERVYTLKQCTPKLRMRDVSDKLIELFPKYFNRPVITGTLSQKEIKASQKTAQKLTDKIFLNDGNKDIPVQPRPLKISADVFIYNKKMSFKNKKINVSFRTDNDIITRVEVEGAVEIEKTIIGRKIEEIEQILYSGSPTVLKGN
jgi:lipoate---protein ligase